MEQKVRDNILQSSILATLLVTFLCSCHHHHILLLLIWITNVIMNMISHYLLEILLWYFIVKVWVMILILLRLMLVIFSNLFFICKLLSIDWFVLAWQEIQLVLCVGQQLFDIHDVKQFHGNLVAITLLPSFHSLFRFRSVILNLLLLLHIVVPNVITVQ